MASSKEYLNFVLEQCNGLTARAMMGEYVLYYGGKVVGGIYDNRLLVKPTPSAVVLMPEAPRELPYEGAKEMLLVEDIDNRGFLNKLFEMMYEELPEPKRKKVIKFQFVGEKKSNWICHGFVAVAISLTTETQ